VFDHLIADNFEKKKQSRNTYIIHYAEICHIHCRVSAVFLQEKMTLIK